MKPCTECKINKALNEFYVSKRAKDGKQCVCKECSSLISKKIKAQGNIGKIRKKALPSGYKGKEAKKHNSLIFYYGITLEQYKNMFEKQNGCCASCGINESTLKRSLHVDHDHSTKVVRALLCSNCNTALGSLKESFFNIMNLAKYLKKYKQDSTCVL